MSTPSLRFSFRHITGDFGTYGPTIRDVSRLGVDGTRYMYTGARGTNTTIAGVAFFRTLGDARSFVTALQNAQGREAVIADVSTGDSRHVLIHTVDATWKKIVATNPHWNYRVRASITLQRMA